METSPDYRKTVIEAVMGDGFLWVTFGGATRGETPCPWKRVAIRTVHLRGEAWRQFSYFDARKDITQNYRDSEAREKLAAVLAMGFSGIHVATTHEEIDVRISKRGKVMIGRRKTKHDESVAEVPSAHNRVKDVPLPEGRADRMLQTMGIMTADGVVKPTMRAKFTQINEFLKLLGHVVSEEFGQDRNTRRAPEAKGSERSGAKKEALRILACGCGSAYLTIATHHYLNDVLHWPAEAVGVDINEEVIRKSINKGEKLGASGLTFAQTPIGQADVSADIVLALHACDTATDDAIAQGIRSRARVIMVVPCCHHDLQEKLAAAGGPAELRGIFRHGILRERTADIVTDAFRALALRSAGYRAEVIEFVSPEHTTRNLMIRAVWTGRRDEEAAREWEAMKEFWGVIPYIETTFGMRANRIPHDRGHEPEAAL